MIKYNFLKISILSIFSIFFAETVCSCSMYKVSAEGKTMLGNNEDSWGRDSRIWFEQGKNGTYGMVCLGYKRKHPNPDGAMNEYGLAFDAFTMHRKANVPEKDPNKNDFAYSHIRTIMQHCKTVDEVYTFLDTLNLHILNGSPIFNGGMFLFADKTGKYLVVEANKMTFGNENKFALANFSFADTKDLNSIKTERYCKGVEFLNNKNVETSISYCTKLSDTMSVHREKIGDGTLYTSIYDLNEGLVHLYFFHDYSKRVSFNIKEELAKGDHAYNFTELFPDNKNYQKFHDYKTPQNNKPIFIFIIACGILFFFSFLYFLITFFKKRNTEYKYFNILISALSIAMCMYTFVLLRNEGIYYFPSPYHDGHSLFIAISSYIPFILLFAMIPLQIIIVKIFKRKEWNGFAFNLLVTNNIAYMILIGLFTYWKLFDIIH